MCKNSPLGFCSNPRWPPTTWISLEIIKCCHNPFYQIRSRYKESILTFHPTLLFWCNSPWLYKELIRDQPNNLLINWFRNRNTYTTLIHFSVNLIVIQVVFLRKIGYIDNVLISLIDLSFHHLFPKLWMEFTYHRYRLSPTPHEAKCVCLSLYFKLSMG